ncbi:MAG: hypothetical protein LC135_13680 [Phycisphaerae bacterium]|nr:hypothetical protein [Phycisphaerae bacterium]MCZ2400900.1 hypothetical protein [Phycisphaerae bacterium]NUQ50356.1 hypothetical protein [Phycisphaerae bacterium]
MMVASGKFISAGTRVRVREAGPVPTYSTWDDDGQRTSTPVKKRMQKAFFGGDRRIQAEVIYIGNESERERLRAKGLAKVQLRDSAGCMVVVTAEVASLIAA